jgi:hypothetical protein
MYFDMGIQFWWLRFYLCKVLLLLFVYKCVALKDGLLYLFLVFIRWVLC